MENEKHHTLQVHMHHATGSTRPPKRKLALANWQVVAGASSFDLNNSPTRIFYANFRETAGAAASFQIKDGNGANDPLLLTVYLAANGYLPPTDFGVFGLLARKNLSFVKLSGSVEGVIGGTLEEDYQADFDQVEVMNFPGEPVEVDPQTVG